MSGTIAGGRKAAQTNMSKWGADYYGRIGSIGGRAKSSTKGFGFDDRNWLEKLLKRPNRARLAGKVEGTKSKRRKSSGN